MGGKKQKQIQNKAKHFAGLNEAKARRSNEPILERSPPYLQKKQTFLIVCEGKNTEPSYFKQFRLSSAIIKSFGKGLNTMALVEHAKLLQKTEKCDQVWCVFDMDSNKPEKFNGAIKLAMTSGFGVAYSNQAFEYWLILHFEDHQGGPMQRGDYNEKINHYINPLGARFEGTTNKKVSAEFFNILMAIDSKTGISRWSVAINRAKRNYSKFNHQNPALEESSTTVFQLVEEIQKYL